MPLDSWNINAIPNVPSVLSSIASFPPCQTLLAQIVPLLHDKETPWIKATLEFSGEPQLLETAMAFFVFAKIALI